MKKTLAFIFTLSFLAVFMIGCGETPASSKSSSTVTFPTTPPDCGSDCPPAFPSA